MSEFSQRWRLTFVLVGGISVLLLLAIIVTFQKEPPRQTENLPAQSETSTPETTIRTPDVHHVQSAPTHKPKPPAAIAQPQPSATSSVKWPVPKDSLGITATFDPKFGDPFDGNHRRPNDVRELTRVGNVRLGVTISSKVRNEVAVIEILKQFGAEIDEKERGRTDDIEKRIHDYEPIVNKYRASLATHMDGAFAMKSGDWTLTEPTQLPDRDAGPHVH